MSSRAVTGLKFVLSCLRPGSPGTRQPVSSEDGGSLAETAIMMPIFFMILVGLFSFAVVVYQKFELAQAISVGGSFLAVDRGDTDPCAATVSKIYAAASGLKTSSLSLTITLNGVATGPSASPSCPGPSGGANANMVSGGTAQISATYPCVLNSFAAFGASFNTACTLQAQVTELVQ